MVKIAITTKPRKEVINLMKDAISIVKYELNSKDMIEPLKEILDEFNHKFDIERYNDTYFYRIYHDENLSKLTIDAYDVHKHEELTEIGIKFQKIINKGILNEKKFRRKKIEKENERCRHQIRELYRISKMTEEEIKKEDQMYTKWFIRDCRELADL